MGFRGSGIWKYIVASGAQVPYTEAAVFGSRAQVKSGLRSSSHLRTSKQGTSHLWLCRKSEAQARVAKVHKSLSKPGLSFKWTWAHLWLQVELETMTKSVVWTKTWLRLAVSNVFFAMCFSVSVQNSKQNSWVQILPKPKPTKWFPWNLVNQKHWGFFHSSDYTML